MKKLSTSDRTFLGLVLIMVIGKVVWTSFQLDHPIVQQSINSWVAVILAAVLGFVALKLAQQTGFPDMWDKKISNKHLDIPMVKFPLSIPVYLFGGIILEIFYRLIPMVLLVWLISNLILRKRWQEQVFWVVAILLCLLEPVMQTIGVYQMGIIASTLLAAILFIFVFAGNLIPTYFFRKYGFLAAIVWRLTDYLVWHIIWPLF